MNLAPKGENSIIKTDDPISSKDPNLISKKNPSH